MKKILFVLSVIFCAGTIQAAQPPTTQDLNVHYPCSKSGEIILTGTYDFISGALNGHLDANNCVMEDNDSGNKSINGHSDISGTLGTTPGSEIHLTITFTNVAMVEESGNENNDYISYTCSGTAGINGVVSTDGSVDFSHSSDMNCHNGGHQHIPMDQFINGLVRFDLLN